MLCLMPLHAFCMNCKWSENTRNIFSIVTFFLQFFFHFFFLFMCGCALFPFFFLFFFSISYQLTEKKLNNLILFCKLTFSKKKKNDKKYFINETCNKRFKFIVRALVSIKFQLGHNTSSHFRFQFKNFGKFFKLNA